MKQPDETSEAELQTVPNVRYTAKFGMRHLQAILLFLCVSVACGMRANMSVAIVAMTDSTSGNPDFKTFNWNSRQQSIILSSTLWGILLTTVPIGYYLTRKGGAHKILCFGILVSGAASILIPVVAQNDASWIAVLCCKVVMGMCQGTVVPCIYHLMASWVPPNERSRLCSFVVNGAQFGTVTVLPASGLLASSRLGWPGIFYIFGGICLVLAVSLFFLAAETPSDHTRMCSRERDYINESLGKFGDVTETESKRFPYKQILKSLPFWALIIVDCGQGWIYYVFLTKLPAFFKYVLGFDIQESGILSAVPYLTMWLMTFPISWLSDLSLSKGATVTVVRKVCTTIAVWGPALCLLALNLIQSKSQSIHLFIFVVSFGLNAAINCGSEVNHIDISPNFSASLVAITNTLSKGCGMLAPIAIGYIVPDMTDEKQWHVVFYITAAILFSTNLIFLIFGTGEKQSWDDQGDSDETTIISKSSGISTSMPFLGESSNSSEKSR